MTLPKDLVREAVLLLGMGPAEKIDHQALWPYRFALAQWAFLCGQHVLPFFIASCPDEHRPEKALKILGEWIAERGPNLAEIREASLESHAAARSCIAVGASYAAHACGQAVATAHVAAHAFRCAFYAVRASSVHSENPGGSAILEKKWQLDQLKKLVSVYRQNRLQGTPTGS